MTYGKVNWGILSNIPCRYHVFLLMWRSSSTTYTCYMDIYNKCIIRYISNARNCKWKMHIRLNLLLLTKNRPISNMTYLISSTMITDISIECGGRRVQIYMHAPIIGCILVPMLMNGVCIKFVFSAKYKNLTNLVILHSLY